MDTVGYLGPQGTYSEMAARAFASSAFDHAPQLEPFATIASALHAVADGHLAWAVVPIENLVEGGVAMTLDTLWRAENLQVHQALVLPIHHVLITRAPELSAVQTVYAHPQALAQCQQWLDQALSQATLVPSRSNTSELGRLYDNASAAIIASAQTAEQAGLPILARDINDYASNCTKFWVMGRQASPGGSHTSLAFSVPANVPGSLVRPLQVLARHTINMTRIESRPTKQSLGTYFFFLDLEHPQFSTLPAEIVAELAEIAEILKIFGSYPLVCLT